MKLMEKYGLTSNDIIISSKKVISRKNINNILEIGVFKGDSIKAWLEFFPNATIYGIDIFKRVRPQDIKVLNDDRVKWLKSDSTNIAVRDQIKKEWPRIRFDIIIDDGSHKQSDQLKALNHFYQYRPYKI